MNIKRTTTMILTLTVVAIAAMILMLRSAGYHQATIEPLVDEAQIASTIDEVMERQAEAKAKADAEAKAKAETKAKAKTKATKSNAQGRYNISESEAKEWIAQHESGGSYTAESPSGKYYGRYQLTKSMLGSDLSPENQEKTADRYVSGRYGSWANAYQHWRNYGWY